MDGSRFRRFHQSRLLWTVLHYDMMNLINFTVGGRMNNILNEVTFGIMSLKDFDNRELAQNVFETIADAGDSFFPTVYDVYEPLRRKCSQKDIDELVRFWVNEENAEKTAQQQYGMGQILMEHRRKPKISYQMYWEKSQHERFNYFVLGIDFEFLKEPKNFQKFMTLCSRLVILLDPVQGEITNRSFPGWDEPINLQVRHPELNWMVYFGKPYIELFGREKLMNTPCYCVNTIGENVISLQMAADVFQPISTEDRRTVKSYLGADAFVEEGKDYRSYKAGIVPKFDFSNVLFDKDSPIIQPSIRMRGTNF